MGNVVYVNPNASANGNGSLAHPLNSWNEVTFTAGTTYLQMSGTTARGSLTVSTSATAEAPIQIGSYGSGKPPMIAGPVNFDGASHVTLTGFTISAGQGAAVVIQNGSNNIQVLSNTLSGSAVGIWLGNGAQGSNTISGNTITGNSLFGIGVSGVSNPIGQATVISNNAVTSNGSHGIELEGNNFVIQGNVVQQNGLTMTGASGIHTYASSSADGFGDDNSIINNLVTGTATVDGVDGNGIELDQWTHGNTVSGNTVCNNEGSGISVYDSWDNTISQNKVYGNDTGTTLGSGANGEIALVSTLSLTAGNVVSGNMFIGTSPNAPVAFVDGGSSTSGNVFSANILENFGGLSMYDWADVVGNGASYWRSVTGGSDWLGGTVPAGGVSYDFDYVFAASPFTLKVRYPWR